MKIEQRWCGPGYPEWEADSRGRVYRNGVEVAPRVIEPRPGGEYLVVGIGHSDVVAVHRLVALAFHGEPPPDAPLVCHANDIGVDNRPTNLYWGDHYANAQDRVANMARRAAGGFELDWAPVSAAIVALREHVASDPAHLRELTGIVQGFKGRAAEMRAATLGVSRSTLYRTLQERGE